MNNKIINFLKYLSLHGVSPKSLKYYKSDLLSFLTWAGTRKISQGLIQEYITEIRLVTPTSTLNRKLSTLRSYGTFLGFKKTVKSSWQDRILSKFESKPKLQTFLNKLFFSRPNWYKKYHSYPIASYVHIAILVLFTSLAGYALYDQVFRTTDNSLAFPVALTRPNRYLSFQGRLTDNLGNPKTVATNMVFKLYSVDTGGASLWDSGTCSITPDQDGIFSTLLGSSCGAEIAATVFSENAAIWLGATMGADAEATPRVQIATVAYALNSETLQGYPAGTGTSTIPYINSSGSLVLANASPKIQSTSGTFAVEGVALTITTPNTSNGVITVNPDGVGTLDLTFEGAAAGLSANGFVNATNANITSGALYGGTVASNATGYNFIDFQSGVSPTSKFSVSATGAITTASGLTIGTTGLSEITSPTDSGAYLVGVNDEFANSNSTNVQAVLNDLDNALGSVSSKWNGITVPDGNLTLAMDADTTTFNWDTLTTGTGFTEGSTSLSSGTLHALLVNSTAAASNTQKVLSLSTAGANATDTQTTYGLYSTNTHTGTASTNVGGYFSASGGSNNYAAIFDQGNVGIGTTVPNYKVDVVAGTSIRGLNILNSQSTANNIYGVYAEAEQTIDDGNQSQYGGFFLASGTSNVQLSIGVYGKSTNQVEDNSFGVYGEGYTFGVYGQGLGATGTGVTGIGLNGVTGSSSTTNGYGGFFYNDNVSGTALAAIQDNASGYALYSLGGKNYFQNNVGIGTTGPDAKLDSLATTEQLRLTYTDGSVYSSHTVDSSGNLTIDNTGTKTIIADDLQINDGNILDSNGNESIRFGTTASAVNEATLTNAAAAGTVLFAATGGDTDIALSIDSKGADALNLNGTATGDILIGGGAGSTGCTITNATGTLTCTVGITASALPFSGLTSATNTTAAMVVGAGASLDFTSTGTINSSSLLGATWAVPGTIGSTTPNTGVFSTLTSTGNLVVQGTTGLTFNTGAGGDITFANGEKIDNDTDGTLALTATTTALSGNLKVTGGNILNSAGTANIILSGTPTTTANTLSASNWLVENTANLGQAALMVNNTKAGDLFTASASGTPKFVITNAGNVGIGTTSPGTKLFIKEDATATIPTSATLGTGAQLTLENNDDTNGNFTGINFETGTTVRAIGLLALEFDKTNGYGDFVFRIRDGSATSKEVMRLTNAGNVGIGTTAPQAILHVQTTGTGNKNGLIIGRNTENVGDKESLLFSTADLGDMGAIDSIITTSNVADLAFRTNRTGTMTEAVRIKGNGNVGIGTTNPGFKLAVNGTIGMLAGGLFQVYAGDSAVTAIQGDAGNVIHFGDGDVDTYFHSWANSIKSLDGGIEYSSSTHYFSGSVGIGDIAPDRLLDVKGSVCLDINADEACTDNTSALSDARLKTNITDLTDPLDLVKQLHPVRFNWNGEYNTGTAASLGFIAQEIETVFPELVITDTAGYKNLDYSKLTAVLAGAIQEQQTQIAPLPGQIASLSQATAEISNLTTQLTDIHSQVTTLSSNLTNMQDQLDQQILTTSSLQNDVTFIKELLGLSESSESSQSTETSESSSSQNMFLSNLQSLIANATDEFGSMLSVLGLSNDGGTLTVNSDMNVLGNTTLNNVVVTGNLAVGQLKIDGLTNSLDITGPACYNADTQTKNTELCDTQTMYLQKGLAGNIDIFNGKVVIQPDGVLLVNGTIKANKVTADEYSVTQASQMTGEAVLGANSHFVTISNPNIKADSKVFVTPTTSTNGQSLIVSEKIDGTSFTVSMDNTINQNVDFDWWILNVE